MYTTDQAPDRILGTPAAASLLSALSQRDDHTVLWLTDGSASLAQGASSLPEPRIFLGEVGGVRSFADGTAETPWWRNRAVIYLDDNGAMTYQLTELSEAEVFEALASGPLPRY